jgi:hypothetical protein
MNEDRFRLGKATCTILTYCYLYHLPTYNLTATNTDTARPARPQRWQSACVPGLSLWQRSLLDP